MKTRITSLLLVLTVTMSFGQSLSQTLTTYLQQLPSGVKVNLAVESLTDSKNAFFHVADEPVPAASVIKLPILIEAMEWVKEGKLNLDEKHTLLATEKTGGSGILGTYPAGSTLAYQDLITLMMTHSDNTATNILIQKLGMDAINRRDQSLGLKQTRLNRVMMDTLAAKQGRENYVTAREMNSLLKKIYHHEVATPVLCDQMIDILKNNRDTLTIPRLLPKTVAIAHKTGMLAYVRGDVGIVYRNDGPAKGPFVLSVFVQGTTTEEAERIIGELAQLGYKQL